MKMRTAIAAFVFLAGPATAANTEFGTKEEARGLAMVIIEIVNTDGITAATSAIADPDGPFRHSRMGINLFSGTTLIADNREPETVAADYSQTADLTGAPVWPRIVAAAERQDDAVLDWYHYDTQEAYRYHCFSMQAERDNGFVMVCR